MLHLRESRVIRLRVHAFATSEVLITDTSEVLIIDDVKCFQFFWEYHWMITCFFEETWSLHWGGISRKRQKGLGSRSQFRAM
ncbi:hypothetical protein ACH5RR_012571 [Cinchona calisaya]|uniref:Uncharacterized protein n=1 Tax=Cinchona calisaya TaxID=153742 RepID=A0ABD3A806_9GENT